MTTDMGKMVRWGIIGPGRAGARFAQGLSGVPGAELASLWGRNPERAEAFATRYAAGRISPTLEDLLAGDLDAVYIATHPNTHADLAIAAMRAGKHVLCEKPSALNVAQLGRILETARSHDRLFMEAMKPPFFPLYRRLQAYLQENSIGDIGFVRAGHCDATLSPDYPLHFAELGGGGIMGIGPYEAFLALDWLGPLMCLQTMGRVSPAGVDNFAIFQTEHERGMAQLHTGLDLLSLGDALLCGTKGYVLLHANWWNPARATVHHIDGRETLLDEPFEHGGFNYETEHFCELVRSGQRESPVISYELSLGMAEMLEQARGQLGVKFPE